MKGVNTLPISDQTMRILLKSQKDEETGALVYEYLSKKEKDPENKKILHKMALDEASHAKTWKSYTKKDVKADKLKFCFVKIISIILGYTFTLKMIQKDEGFAQKEYELLKQEIPEAISIQEDEQKHEAGLISMLDEERLQYVGAMVLGLNDALVELTGAIAGLSFALANTKVVALSGIVTGISATLSMAASNYLAEKADGNPHAFKSSIFTGVAYLITVALMVLPYLLLPQNAYVEAFLIMIGVVILIILVFNYYISIAKDQPFFKNFAKMALISISVAGISYLIGILAKNLLGIDVM